MSSQEKDVEDLASQAGSAAVAGEQQAVEAKATTEDVQLRVSGTSNGATLNVQDGEN